MATVSPAWSLVRGRSEKTHEITRISVRVSPLAAYERQILQFFHFCHDLDFRGTHATTKLATFGRFSGQHGQFGPVVVLWQLRRCGNPGELPVQWQGQLVARCRRREF